MRVYPKPEDESDPRTGIPAPSDAETLALWRLRRDRWQDALRQAPSDPEDRVLLVAGVSVAERCIAHLEAGLNQQLNPARKAGEGA